MLIGIDASSTYTAITCLIDSGEYIESTLIVPDKKLSLDDRGLIMVKEVIDYVKNNKEITRVAIEYSAFGAKGKVVDLSAINGGILYGLRMLGISVEKFAPTSVKKFATGSGRATKEDMEAATPAQLVEQFKGINKKIDDLVDSYWIAKFLHNKIKGK